MARRVISVIVASLLWAASASAASWRAGGLVMGTVLDVEVHAASLERARELGAMALGIAQHWDDILSNWRAEAELERLNRNAGTWVRVSPELLWALDRMLSLREATGGAFEPCVGRFVFGADSNRERGPAPHLPEVLRTGPHAVRLDSLCRVDSGGIGKGMAIDAIVASLVAEGTEAVFVNFGGSSQTFVSAGDDSPVRIAVPRLYGHGPLGTVLLRNASLATSRTPAEPASGALVDPRSGEAVHEARLASACAATATDADAWSTALAVLGRAGLPLAERHGIRALLQEGKRIFVTPSFTGPSPAEASSSGFVCQFDTSEEHTR